jgi:SHS2 domain-containing protein
MFHLHFLPHTADIRVRIEADSLEDLFLAGVTAMNEVLMGRFCDEENLVDVEETIETDSIDTTALLIDFLSDVLTLCHSEKALFCKLNVSAISPTRIRAKVGGTKVDGFHDDIKAVTYHEAEVVQNEKGWWETMVIFDI